MKTVFITGSSRGIGYATARYFGLHGWNVVINACHDLDRLERAKNELEADGIPILALPGDVSIPDFWESAKTNILSQFHSIDCIINNAAISYVGLLSDMTLAEWNRLMQINLSSLFCCAKVMTPLMVQNRSGCLLNITSVWGEVGASCEVAYSASKGAVIAFTKALAKELAPSKVSVNAVSLGMFDTEMNACFSEEDKAAIVEEIPASRMGSPTEAAELLYSLANTSNYLTGQVIRLDGGWI